MTLNNSLFGLILTLSFLVISCGSTGSKLAAPALTTNSKASLTKPYVILISLDGFRWDYVDKYAPPNLSAFINDGVKAESLIPSFPSKTFPNHYTIATGMYPDKHGIVGNSFYSKRRDATYKIRNREMVEDGSFYGGTPIWLQADKEDMVSASFFFVGSEANIQGKYPTYYNRYDGSIKNEDRIAQALKWLQLPEKERPHIITMYFSDMDDTGHRFSPGNDEELKKALFALDKDLGDLFTGIAATGLPINTIIVSDHGMATVPISNYIPVETVTNDDLYRTVDNGAIVNIHPNDGISVDSILAYLSTIEGNFNAYSTADTPGFEYLPSHENWGAVQVIPAYGYYFSSLVGIGMRKKSSLTVSGVHGYDPANKEMHGIFYANGPAFKEGYVTESVKNIHVYPLMCEILELEIPKDIDGQLDQLKHILKTNK